MKPFDLHAVSLRPGESRTPVRIASLFLAAVLASNGIVPSFAASDEQLVELLRENLADSGIDDTALSFTESDGIVTLTGRVENAQAKANIIDLVRRTDGVVSIIDKISTDY